MRIVAIIQARLGSTRLPKKVLEDLAGQPMLARVVNRTRRAKSLAEVVVATTTLPADDALAELCRAQGWPCYRGQEQDLLDRYYQAALEFQAEAVVRITSDCPLIDPEIIDKVNRGFLAAQPNVEYASNTLAESYPRGLDVEVMQFATLAQAWQEDKNPAWREHATQYIRRQPDRFRMLNIASDKDYSHMRWTVDTPEDLELIRRIYSHFQTDAFSWQDVLKLLETHPDWLDINRHIQQKIVP